MLSSDVETESEADQGGQAARKKPRFSRRESNKEFLELLREDSRRSADFMKAFFVNAEQERKEQRERWEQEREKEGQERARHQEIQDKEFALRQRQFDLQFAELEERRLEREQRRMK